ncbi:hypothetical protein E4U59_003975 [Claviceps monticola]|nr:hypothetical protein E4U59_003975 [Claviceps monticola]
MAQLSLEPSAPMSVDTRDEDSMSGSLQVPDSQYGTELMRDLATIVHLENLRLADVVFLASRTDDFEPTGDGLLYGVGKGTRTNN